LVTVLTPEDLEKLDGSPSALSASLDDYLEEYPTRGQ
jgi:hypothetical protein